MRDFYNIKELKATAVNDKGELIAIVSDGTSDNTQILNENGNPLGLVLQLTVSIEHGKQIAVVELTRED